MKKALKLKLTLCILFVIYAIMLIAINLLPLKAYKNLWFSLALLLFSIYLFYKAVLMNSDSSLWLSITFFLSSISVFLSYNTTIFKDELLLLVGAGAGVSSLILYFVWQNAAHLYIFVTTVIGTIPAVFYTYKVINLLWFVVLVAVTLVINYLLLKLFIWLFCAK